MKLNRNLFIAVFAAIILIGLYRREFFDNKIKSKHVVLCGTILSIISGRGGLYIKYQFKYNGHIFFNNDGRCTQQTYIRYHEHGISGIRVVIEKNKPKNRAILEDWKDYEKYNIVQTDTLGIVCP